MSQETVQAIRGLYDAFNRGDLDTLEQGFRPGLLWNEPENSIYAAGNPYRGFEAVRNGCSRRSPRTTRAISATSSI